MKFVVALIVAILTWVLTTFADNPDAQTYARLASALLKGPQESIKLETRTRKSSVDLANLCLVVFVAVVAVGLLGINSSILQLPGGIAGLARCVLVVVGNRS